MTDVGELESRNRILAHSLPLPMIVPLWSLAAAAAVFWQPNSPPADNLDYELPVSSFGSHGRLFSIDATLRAVEHLSTSSVVSLCCSDGVVTVFTTTYSPYICSKDMVVNFPNNDLVFPPFAKLDPSSSDPVHSVVAGTGVDQLLLRELILQICQKSFMERTSVGSTARRLADELQLRTQDPSKGRVLVAAVLLFDSKGLWKADASGQFWKLQAAVIGKHSAAIEQAILEKTNRLALNTKVASPNDRIAHLSSSQGLSIARDAILSVYSQRSAEGSGSDNGETSTDIRIQGCITSGTVGHRAIGHDYIMKIGSD